MCSKFLSPLRCQLPHTITIRTRHSLYIIFTNPLNLLQFTTCVELTEVGGCLVHRVRLVEAPQQRAHEVTHDTLTVNLQLDVVLACKQLVH